jgi:hypothetical protein
MSSGKWFDEAHLESDSQPVKTKHATPSAAHEPCAECGEETAVGSVFFSDRRRIDRADGTVAYLCSLCDARLAASHHKERLTDEEISRLASNWSAAVNAFTGGH